MGVQKEKTASTEGLLGEIVEKKRNRVKFDTGGGIGGKFRDLSRVQIKRLGVARVSPQRFGRAKASSFGQI